MSTFVLVHGAWHGGWCWDRLVPELATRGHDAIVMDLPVEDGSATFTPAYAKHVCRTRLGIEPIELPGGHSPFLARPAHLADTLTGNVRR